MARVTVEDCLKQIHNRFELVIHAAKRARQLARGRDEPKVAWGNHKVTVLALREIALGKTNPEHIEQVEQKQFNDYSDLVQETEKTDA